MPSQKLLAVSRTFFVYAPKLPRAGRGAVSGSAMMTPSEQLGGPVASRASLDWRGGAEGAGSSDVAHGHHGQSSTVVHQFDVKSNLSPVSRMFFKVRMTNIPTPAAPSAVRATRMATSSQGAACTISI